MCPAVTPDELSNTARVTVGDGPDRLSLQKDYEWGSVELEAVGDEQIDRGLGLYQRAVAVVEQADRDARTPGERLGAFITGIGGQTRA